MHVINYYTIILCREQRTENREQRTENREQRTENREQRTENREQVKQEELKIAITQKLIESNLFFDSISPSIAAIRIALGEKSIIDTRFGGTCAIIAYLQKEGLERLKQSFFPNEKISFTPINVSSGNIGHHSLIITISEEKYIYEGSAFHIQNGGLIKIPNNYEKTETKRAKFWKGEQNSFIKTYKDENNLINENAHERIAQYVYNKDLIPHEESFVKDLKDPNILENRFTRIVKEDPFVLQTQFEGIRYTLVLRTKDLSDNSKSIEDCIEFKRGNDNTIRVGEFSKFKESTEGTEMLSKIFHGEKSYKNFLELSKTLRDSWIKFSPILEEIKKKEPDFSKLTLKHFNPDFS